MLLLSASVLTARPCGRGSGKAGACSTLSDSKTSVVLSASAIEALRFQIDEERMAGELYRAFGEKWAIRPFKNIPRAEDRHHALLVKLASRAGLPLAEVTKAGRYESSVIQTRYHSLLAQGEASLTEALSAGAFVEEQDIADLHSLVAATDNEDLKSVASVLEVGSQNHLRAFVRNLRSRGIDYAPQILTEEELAGIIAARN